MSAKKRQIREAFRNAVFKRDGYTCVYCPTKTNLDAHHITDRNEMPNGGYVASNGITLCEAHHMMAEEYHISGGKKFVKNMSPTDLYRMIDSSYERAVRDSERLN
jgi:5-methylcytosine-specific restriction endonuclease McrA